MFPLYQNYIGHFGKYWITYVNTRARNDFLGLRSIPLPSESSLTSEASDFLSLFWKVPRSQDFSLWILVPNHYSYQNILSRELDFLQW